MADLRARIVAPSQLLTAGFVASVTVVAILSRAPQRTRLVPLVVPHAIAVAAPIAPPTTAAIPTRAVTCVDKSTTLTMDSGAAMLCWGASCLAYTPWSQPEPTEVPEPAPAEPPPPIEVAPRVVAVPHGLAICTGEDCTRLGPRLTAALTAAHDREVRDNAESGPPSEPEANATRDHRVVTFQNEVPEAWDVRRDRTIQFTPPASYGAGEAPFRSGVTPIGNQLIVEWTACAGPCARGIVADRTGRNHGEAFEAGAIVQDSLDRFVVFGELGDMTVIEDGRAIAFDHGAHSWEGDGEIRMAKQGLAALIDHGDAWRLITFDAGESHVLAQLPHCD